MKKLTPAVCLLCVLFACNSAITSTENKTDTTIATTDAPDENITYAYTPTYSGDLTIGDRNQAKTVLDVWKDYDNNTLDNHKDVFADTLTFDFFDGSTLKGPRDTVLGALKKYRGSLSSATSTVEVVVPLKPKGKDESWVCVWGKEIDTHDKKTDSIFLNENWRFNKDGKVAYIGQLASRLSPPAKK
jgi:hypothetical protein